MQDHTDDYPHIEIAFHVDVRGIGESSGLALLFTESQGELHAPWGACLGGKMFSLPGEVGHKAKKVECLAAENPRLRLGGLLALRSLVVG
jgi:hypothetical protein